MTVITYQSLASIFLFMPFVIPEIKRWPELGSISPFILANLVFLGVVCSALEYLFYFYAVKRPGATVSTTFLNLIPVVTVVSGTLLLQEELLWIEVFGMGLIMASIYALNRITSQSAHASENKGKKSSNLATIILNGKSSLSLRLQSLRPICLHIFLMFRMGR